MLLNHLLCGHFSKRLSYNQVLYYKSFITSLIFWNTSKNKIILLDPRTVKRSCGPSALLICSAYPMSEHDHHYGCKDFSILRKFSNKRLALIWMTSCITHWVLYLGFINNVNWNSQRCFVWRRSTEGEEKQGKHNFSSFESFQGFGRLLQRENILGRMCVHSRLQICFQVVYCPLR